MRRLLWAVALAAALGAAGAQADEATPRVVYTIGTVQPMPDSDDVIATLTARLKSLGLDPSIRQQGTVLMVEADAPADAALAADLLTKPGRFAIHAADKIVESCVTPPEGMLCLPTIEPKAPFVIVEREPALGHAAIARAVAITGERQVPQVALSLTGPASEAFAEFTLARQGRRIAIVIDGIVITAPRIQGAVTSGAAVLAGPGIPSVAWAIMLSHPPLPEPLTILGLERARATD